MPDNAFKPNSFRYATTWQEKLAMLSAALHESAGSGVRRQVKIPAT